MIDFRKKLSSREINKKINPLEIYDNLDRKSETGKLRPAQSKILDAWFSQRQTEKDLIIKLHTGEGKTLIGLLILQSRINQNRGSCIFICPNIYLVHQVSLEADKFGIPHCLIQEDNEFPNEFLEGKKILITHIQKLFNGKSKFGIDNNFITIDSIILDDSHACIDSIKNSFTIRINKEHDLYKQLINLFKEELKEQGEGSMLDIENGDFNTLLPIPYWSWIDKKSEVLALLAKSKNDKSIAFCWPIIKNTIDNCQALVTGNEIEIIPYHIPIRNFGSFSNATQRILMSATTQDDSFFIKGLGFTLEAVKNPLTDIDQKWSGEKMLLLPSLIDESLDRETIITKFAPPSKKNFGVVALTSSFKKSELYSHLKSKVVNSNHIFEIVSSLKNKEFDNTVVIVNRYDGIDLPDEACRVLIIDSLPFFSSLADKYEEQCRLNSDIINIKIAQKIEQGLGRSVRGEKDYSIILLIGADIVKFVKSIKTNKFFSAQTKKQIEIGLQIAEMAREDIKENDSEFRVVLSLIKQSLNRDEAWKEFYKEEMDKLDVDRVKSDVYHILQYEKEAEEASYIGNYELAAAKIQELMDNFISDESEKGWYLQLLARYTYFVSKTESNKIQKSAFSKNLQLLKPRDGITYKRMDYINENRLKRIKDWFSNYKTYDELMLTVDSLLSDFSFGGESEKFENSVKELGKLLGFISQRPDKEYRKGPDNLWCGIDNKYFLIECKSEVDDNRDEISKHEAGQMNSHCGWFEGEYGNDTKVTRIIIIPTKNVSYYANFTHKVEVMRKGKLKLFKSAIKSFIKEFKPYSINEISDVKLHEFIETHKLDLNSLENLYTEPYYKKLIH